MALQASLPFFTHVAGGSQSELWLNLSLPTFSTAPVSKFTSIMPYHAMRKGVNVGGDARLDPLISIDS